MPSFFALLLTIFSYQSQNIAPVGVCLAVNLALGNAAYLYLTVSFIQMLKAFTPVVVLTIGIVCGLEKAERNASTRVMCITVFLLTTDEDCQSDTIHDRL
jgi:TRAP-type uncharacterized transport system fused permease subunit